MHFFLNTFSLIILVLVIFLVFDLRKSAKMIAGVKSIKDGNSQLWIMILLVLIAIIAIPSIFINFNPYIIGEESGQLGDTVGGITAPFINGFAAILLYLALKAQIDANNLVQKQFKKQEIDNLKIHFENTFFNMLKIHHQIVDNMDFKLNRIYDNKETDLGQGLALLIKDYLAKNNKVTESDGELLRSRDIFKETSVVLRGLIHKLIVDETMSNKNEDWVTKAFKEIYLEIYSKLGSDLGHYYRNLYRIIKLIDRQDFGIAESKEFDLKYHYVSIVRSQLSDDEVVWLFYNGLYDYGEKFKPLIVKYSLLKILNRNTSPEIEIFKKRYEKKAFDQNAVLEQAPRM